MMVSQSPPLLLYDDGCYYCTRFAFLVYRLYAWMGSMIMLVGFNSTEGYRIRSILSKHCSNDPDSMFWLLYINHDRIKAYGGRVALFRLVIELIRSAYTVVVRRCVTNNHNHNLCIMDYGYYSNADACRVLMQGRCTILSRVISLLGKGESITIEYNHMLSKID
ncbi:MAG: hypothetical protein QW178_00405 [Candidatus Nitrosocaldus sp.]